MEGFEWKIVSSMEKVFPVREPSGEGVNLIPGQWRSLWVDLEAQDSSAPGVYPVSVRMVRNRECMGTVDMSFEILNADLPPLPIPHTEWFHSDCLAEYYQVEVFSEEYWRITENFIRAAVKRKCNMILTPVFTPPLDTAVGGYRLPVQLTDVVFENGHWVFGFEKLRHRLL